MNEPSSSGFATLGCRRLVVLLILGALGQDLVGRIAPISPFRDLLPMPQRGQRLDVDPTVVPIVDAKEGNTALDGEHHVVGGAAADRVDSFHAHPRRTGREHAELRVKHQLLAHRERNGGDRPFLLGRRGLRGKGSCYEERRRGGGYGTR